MKKITTLGLQIYTFHQKDEDFISLTDIARYKNKDFTADVIKNWMRNRRVHGKRSTILNSNWSISTSLELKRAQIALSYRPRAGLKKHQPSV